jgi:hypothetical protein
VEVKIGVQHAPRELVFESTQDRDAVIDEVRKALGEPDGLIVLSDERGRTIVVPAARLAYVEVGEESTRKVGFGG